MKTLGYLVKDKSETVFPYLGPKGWKTERPKEYLKRSNALSQLKDWRKHLEQTGGCDLVIVRIVQHRPIRGWIIRKRHPFVFTTRHEAEVQARSYGDCKVVPVRDGHEALDF